MREMPAIDGAAPVSVESRQRLRAALPQGTGLAGLAADLLAADLPTAYLEAFRPATRPRARVVVSGTGWVADERFKRLAAAAQAEGAQLVAMQHGGYYGMLAAHSPECHEERVADEYLTAGWMEPLVPDTRITPMPMPTIGKVPRGGGRGDILFVTTMHPRYLYRLQSHPVGPQWADYLRTALMFVGALPAEIRARLRVRLYPFDYGWAVPRAWRDAHPEVDVRPSDGDMHGAMARADLIVIDHPATAMLEAAASDRPHVLFWNPARFEMRPGARVACDALRRAGILADDPAAAAQVVSRAAEDPVAWWHDPRRRAATQAFRTRYACGEQGWSALWQQHLLTRLSAQERR